jgi:two-component system, chemotaxis family, protein-glutamate methylesterase/glutaminase
MKKIRVLIVDDSPLARELLRDFLESEDDMEVVGEAGNGLMAVELAGELMPDVITMDLEMPVMHGFEAIEAIMCRRAIPILVVSSVANAQNALEAVGRGALEVLNKPSFLPEEAAQFVAKVRLLAGISVITRLRPRKTPPPPVGRGAPQPSPGAAPPAVPSQAGYAHVFAIASSTGGPQALAQILPALPADYPCPVVIAQHIADGFAAGMAAWLASICKLPVRLAADGESLAGGVIYIAPSERHMAITPTRRVALLERGPLDIFHPSCDVLLTSVADVFGRQAIGIILTGMSSDGAKGLARIRHQGGVTLAQDEATSVIYGMNRVAIEAGSAQHVLPVEAIAEAMVRFADTPPKPARAM